MLSLTRQCLENYFFWQIQSQEKRTCVPQHVNGTGWRLSNGLNFAGLLLLVVSGLSWRLGGSRGGQVSAVPVGLRAKSDQGPVSNPGRGTAWLGLTVGILPRAARLRWHLLHPRGGDCLHPVQQVRISYSLHYNEVIRSNSMCVWKGLLLSLY